MAAKAFHSIVFDAAALLALLAGHSSLRAQRAYRPARRDLGLAGGVVLFALVATPASPQDSFGQAQQLPQQSPPQQTVGDQPPAPGGFGQPPGFGSPPAVGLANLDALTQLERHDYGVTPTQQLHAGQMHGPTPASIPGGQVITTKELVELLRGGQALVLDVLGGPEIIQGAQYAVPAAQSGTFNDQTQQQFGQYLQQTTNGNRAHPIVTYCLSTQCWMSYNAALRAINLGYTNVLWYRGGIEAWKQAGMPTQRMQ